MTWVSSREGPNDQRKCFLVQWIHGSTRVWAKSSTWLVYVIKVLLGQGHIHFHVIYSGFHDTAVESSGLMGGGLQ